MSSIMPITKKKTKAHFHLELVKAHLNRNLFQHCLEPLSPSLAPFCSPSSTCHLLLSCATSHDDNSTGTCVNNPRSYSFSLHSKTVHFLVLFSPLSLPCTSLQLCHLLQRITGRNSRRRSNNRNDKDVGALEGLFDVPQKLIKSSPIKQE